MADDRNGFEVAAEERLDGGFEEETDSGWNMYGRFESQDEILNGICGPIS